MVDKLNPQYHVCRTKFWTLKVIKAQEVKFISLKYTHVDKYIDVLQSYVSPMTETHVNGILLINRLENNAHGKRKIFR